MIRFVAWLCFPLLWFLKHALYEVPARFLLIIQQQFEVILGERPWLGGVMQDAKKMSWVAGLKGAFWALPGRFEGQSLCLPFLFFFCTLPKILEILRTGSGLGGKKCCVTPLHTGSESILGVLVGPARALYRLKSSYVLLKEKHFVFGVPHGGWSESPSSGSLVMEGFWLQ